MNLLLPGKMEDSNGAEFDKMAPVGYSAPNVRIKHKSFPLEEMRSAGCG
jgi:hypothetical protein